VLRITEPSDDVTVTIDGTAVQFWNEVTITKAIDAFTTFTLNAPFDHTDANHRRIFRPLQDQPIEIKIGGELEFTGTVVGVIPQGTPSESSVTISGYSRAGVLVDSTMPDGEAREFSEVPLSFIVDHIATAFGLGASIILPTGDPPFAKVKLELDDTVLDFMVELAQQRGAIISDDVYGDPVVWVPNEEVASVAYLAAEVASRAEPQFNGQKYFSHIYGYTQTNRKRGRVGERYEYANPLAPPTLTRAHFFKVQDADNEDAPAVVAAKIGRMFGEVAQWNLPEVPSWRDPDGKLWRPNTKVTLLAPQLMIYTASDFLVRTVTLHATPNSRTADLGLVMPGVFSGVTPAKWPFDEPATSF
jgi:prophage tail gpP-like protein